MNPKDSLLALILPGMMNIFYLLIMRSFVSAIPPSLMESAKIDGAGEFRIFIQIVLPLLGSGLATIGLFIALGYWNDWYNAMLYINTESKYPLQYMLYDFDHNDRSQYLSEFDWYRSRYINRPYNFMLNNKVICAELIQHYVMTPKIFLIKSRGHYIAYDQTTSDNRSVLSLLKKHTMLYAKPISAGKGNACVAFFPATSTLQIRRASCSKI